MDQALSPEAVRAGTRNKVVIALAVGLSLFACVWGLNRWLRPSLDFDELRVSVVRRGAISNTINASGVVIPVHEEQVAAPMQTRITRVLVKAGQEVKAGQLLLELDDSSVRLVLDNLQEQIDQQENLSTRLKLELGQKLKTLASEIELLELDLESAKVLVERHKKMRAIGATSASELAAAELSVRKLDVQLRQHHEAIIDTRRVAETTIEGARLQRAILQKQFGQSQQLAAETQVRAPIAGMLTWLLADEGASLANGQMLAKVSELRNFRVEATVSDFYARYLSAGQRVRVLYSGLELPGEVHIILPAIQSGSLKLLVNLAEPTHAMLRNQLRVDVNIITEEKANVLLADTGPAINGQGRQDVFVIANAVAEKRALDFGLSDGNAVEVRAGSTEGDRIIVSDVSRYKHLARIRVRE
jgi:HlyD family secretion protein